MPRYVLFLDDGGVISDNRLRPPQWQRLVGEFFPPLLGGSPEAWAEANRVVADGMFRGGAWERRLAEAPDYSSFERPYMLDWLWGMCDAVGVPRPPEGEALDLARRGGAWITSRVRADFPGAVDTLRRLKQEGYTLYTASAGSSIELAGYMGATGVLDLFTRLYGADLVNANKSGPHFYTRIFQDAGASPSEALVVESDLDPALWAVEAGAQAVLVGDHHGSAPPGVRAVIGSLADLPNFLLEA